MRTTLTRLLLADQYQKLRYRCALAMYLLILILGSIPGARADIGQYASGLVLHSAAYSVLTFLIFSGGPGTSLQRATQAVLTIMLMGALDELVQSFVPYRHGAVSDWLVDCGAAVVSAVFLYVFLPGIKQRLLPS
ncbi:VanZ family protein [Oxalobacteraceae bacterium GrIS 1.11]